MDVRPCIAFGMLSLLAAASAATAQPAEESPQVRALAEALADDFDYRVQIQAALAMGEISDAAVIPYLMRALRDRHALVRAAAANSLAKVGDARSLDALRAMRESDSTVAEAVENAIAGIESRFGLARPYVPPPWERARLYVAVGDLSDGTGGGAPLVERFRSALIARLERMSETIVGRETRPSADVSARLASHRSVRGLFLTGSVTEMAAVRGPAGLAVHARVSLVVLDYAGQNICAMLTGTATSRARDAADAAREDELRGVALARAVAAALAGLERDLRCPASAATARP